MLLLLIASFKDRVTRYLEKPKLTMLFTMCLGLMNYFMFIPCGTIVPTVSSYNLKANILNLNALGKEIFDNLE